MYSKALNGSTEEGSRQCLEAVSSVFRGSSKEGRRGESLEISGPRTIKGLRVLSRGHLIANL